MTGLRQPRGTGVEQVGKNSNIISKVNETPTARDVVVVSIVNLKS